LTSLLAAPRPWRARTPRIPAARLVAACVAATLLLGACAPRSRPEPVPAPRPDRADLPAPAPIAHALALEPTPAPTVAAATPAPLPHEAHLPGVTFDLDVHDFEHEERVQHYVRLFTGNARGTFTGWMARGARYETMIRAKLRAGGLPEDLRFLPLVESGYDVHAVSRASAVGMWQFMAPTARDVGLRVDWWVDERRDPVRATDAAVRMLRWLKSEFGSLFVAAAAYNGGPGRVSRGLAQLAAESDSAAGDARFFSLVQRDYIRLETKNYVPQLIAAALIGNEPSRYRLSVREAPPFAYDSAVVPALTPLAAVAKAAGASRAQLLDLNPHFLRGLTPPDARATVRLPVGTADGFARRFSQLDERDRRAFRRTITRRRDALSAIAAREDVPVALVAALNPRLETVRSGKYRGRIVSGQAVRVPTAAVLAYARGSVADAAANDEPGPLPALAAEPVKTDRAGDEKPARTAGRSTDATRAADAGEVEPSASSRTTREPDERASTKSASKSRTGDAESKRAVRTRDDDETRSAAVRGGAAASRSGSRSASRSKKLDAAGAEGESKRAVAAAESKPAKSAGSAKPKAASTKRGAAKRSGGAKSEKAPTAKPKADARAGERAADAPAARKRSASRAAR
jgi:membrane-bound lytic murein transglycosylase D